jgi:hypothetical protein
MVQTADGHRSLTCVSRNQRSTTSPGDIEEWLEGRCVGGFVVTPAYVCFEDASDATLFKLGFIDGN